jgi:phosphate transport system substrate-binding protein
MSFARTPLALGLALAIGGGSAGLAPSPASAEQITGAGSTLAQPVYEKWADASKAATGVTLNYQGVGSGAGQKLVFQRTVDFGASDAPVPPAKLAQNKLLQFPTVIGAVDIAINLPGIQADKIRLDGPTIAAIYLGTITSWNDPAIAKLNPGVKLPAIAIAPVYRADGSGTTYVFTGYLAKVSADFKSKVGVDKAVSWPAGTGAKGTAGVAGAVKNTVGGLGYVESAYATLNHLTTVRLKAHDGAFLKPTPAAFSAAAANADWGGAKDFAVDMNDQPGANSWPIVSTTFVLLPTNPTDPAKGAAVLKFFGWAMDDGDAAALSLQYIPLPAKVKAQVKAAWKAMK